MRDEAIAAAMAMAGQVVPTERVAEAAPLVRAMMEVARKLESLGMTEPPSGLGDPP